MTIFFREMRIRQCLAGSPGASPVYSNTHIGQKQNRPEVAMISERRPDWAEFAGSRQNFPENAE
jgi:hypothetical protein